MKKRIKYQSCGHVWQGRFKSPIVSDDEYMLEAMRYIEKNPVKAKMVKKVEDYRWSSYLLNLRKMESKLIDRTFNEAYMGLGENHAKRVEAYQAMIIENDNSEKLKLLEKSMKGAGNYMSEKFANQIEDMLPKKCKRGRPRKN